MKKTATKNLNLAEAMKELEAINRWFQEEEVDVEKGLLQLKRAQELSEQIKARLESVENEFIQIKESFSPADDE